MNGEILAYPGTTEDLSQGETSPPSGYYPPEWSAEPQLTFIEDYYGNLWFFDAFMRVEHVRSVRITEHPVQSGANISDHSFQMAARLTLEIAMSDSMASYQVGQYEGGSSRSAEAYQQLVTMLNQRLPMTITTRLDTYQNMVMEQLAAPDDFQTKYGLTAIVMFKEIILATVAQATVSVRPQATQTTNTGPVQPTPPQGSAVQGLLQAAGVENP